MLLAVQFARFGPYHFTRLRSAMDALGPLGWTVAGFQTASKDATYAWNQNAQADLITVFQDRVYEEIPAGELRRGVTAALDRIRPDAVAIAAWGFPDARACLDWCKKNRAQAILMSETRAADGHRVWWKELLKSRIVRRFDAALVGGRSHAEYLVTLGMQRERISFGYDVVDDRYFEKRAAAIRNGEFGMRSAEQSNPPTANWLLPTAGFPYFLASNRFIERKNLARLVEAYAEFRQMCNSQFSIRYSQLAEADASSNIPNSKFQIVPWNLCLLGDGELKQELMEQCNGLGLAVAECAPWEEKLETGNLKADNCQRPTVGDAPTVYFPGFRQIEELPYFYARAGCFVHPALEEPWGLVLNEAAACGLPILSGDNVGAAEELVEEGVNGRTFPAESIKAMSHALFLTAGSGNEALVRMGRESSRILAERAPAKAFGEGLARIFELNSRKDNEARRA